VFGTNVTAGYDDLDHRFDSWPVPAIVSLASNWVGELPATPVLTGGEGGRPPTIFKHGRLLTKDERTPHPVPRLKDTADALLYLRPRDSLTVVLMSRAELEGTPYGKEIQRRLTVEGFPSNFANDNNEAPQFSRPQEGGTASPPLPPPPKNMGAPLPPPPPSQ
jgi:hypothetical protein